MANLKSSKKRVVQNEKRRKKNIARKTAIKTSVKKVLLALEQGSDVEKIKELLQQAEASLARAKGKKVVHHNTAARKISRLAKKVAQKERTK